MAIQMSDKFKKNLPPGKGNGMIKLDPRESNGTFNKPQPENPAKAAGRHPGFQKPTGTVGTFKPNPAKAPGAHPGFQKPTGRVGNFPANPAKAGGKISLDPREWNGGLNTNPKKGVSGKPVPKGGGVQKFQPTANSKPGAHQEFVNRAKAQGIGQKEITRFLAKKMKPKGRK